ncbi:hypothetical protein [Pseudomonas phage PEV2]|uniref:Uncharacterized protein n=1 Tax=Pseudomonas phage PEV2 TaxID=1837850 RepID=A0A191ZBM1_9CAUD|nr:hypothetical protein BI066_gp54 [Pseudomonas phage PEV2]ANJ63770.1 hypothetical protein [Pseudomonas phage PEV2]
METTSHHLIGPWIPLPSNPCPTRSKGPFTTSLIQCLHRLSQLPQLAFLCLLTQ